MLQAVANYRDESAFVEDVSEFKMSFNAIAAYQLMSGIAKDKIGYPVREICTNAWDAAKGDFEVHLPTHLVPTFRVRDYGPGLSHEQVTSIYTTFFGGTKAESNDDVGGKGLGSKSPFAYLISAGQGQQGAAAFNVTSWHGGKVRHYVMALNPKGMPQCKLMLTRDMEPEESTGIEVSFPVRADDIWRFQHKVREIVWHFDPRPQVFPDPWADTNHNSAPIETGDNWTLYQNNVPFDGPHVRMGCVAYPISLSNLEMRDWPWKDQHIVFDTPIGSIEVQTSREELGYDDRTKQVLVKLLEDFEKTYVDKLQAEIDAQPNYRAARNVLKQLAADTNSDMANRMQKRVKWKTHEITWRHYRISDGLRVDGRHLHYRPEGLIFDREKPAKNEYHVEFSRDIDKFVWELKPNRSSMKLAKLFDDGALALGDHILWMRPGTEARFKDVMDKVFHEDPKGPDVICLDDVKLPPQPKVARAPRPDKTLTKVEVYDEGHEYLDLSKNWMFIVDNREPRERRERYRIRNNSGIVYPHTIRNSITVLKEHKILPTDFQLLVYRKGTPVPDNLIWFGDWLAKELPKHLNQLDLKRLIEARTPINAHAALLVGLRKKLTPNRPADVGKVLNEVGRVLIQRKRKNKSSKTEELLPILKEVGYIEPTFASPTSEANASWQALIKKYPIIYMLIDKIEDGYPLSSWSKPENWQPHLESLNHYLQLEHANGAR